MVHEKKKPFNCDIFDYSCSQKSYLKKHFDRFMRRRSHFKCSIYDWLQMFAKHMNRVMKLHILDYIEEKAK